VIGREETRTSTYRSSNQKMIAFHAASAIRGSLDTHLELRWSIKVWWYRDMWVEWMHYKDGTVHTKLLINVSKSNTMENY